MIYTSKLKTDLRSREILPGNFEENLIVCMKPSLEKYTHRQIPWHWHDCFEIDYVVSGELEVHTSESVCNLRQGDILFLNNGVMHNYAGLGSEPCVAYAILFDMHFLSGLYNSSLERKYMLPLKESGLECISFSPDTNQRLAMARSILNAVELFKNEPIGYEMQVRSELSSFWIQLLNETRDFRAAETKTSSTDKDRIKKMLEYIHTAYADKITVESIAQAAGISERECCRCFARCIGKPPVKYLTEYRLHVAAEMLLETDASILEVSEACGFSSSSYFGKNFLSVMGCTPKEYRSSGGTAGMPVRGKGGPV